MVWNFNFFCSCDGIIMRGLAANLINLWFLKNRAIRIILVKIFLEYSGFFKKRNLTKEESIISKDTSIS